MLGGRRAAYHELDGQYDLPSRTRAVRHPLDEEAHGGGPDRAKRLAHGRELRAHQPRQQDVVEADHGDVARHPHPVAFERADDGDGDGVVGARHRVEPAAAQAPDDRTGQLGSEAALRLPHGRERVPLGEEPRRRARELVTPEAP